MAIKRIADVSYAKTVKMMIYGQAGMGKSTLALSAPKPVYIDFDGSGKRLNYVDENQPTIYPQSWQDIKTQFTTEAAELAPFQSVVVDTAGKMMDMIISYKCGSRLPRIQDWSGINAEFSWFMRELTKLNKNVIVVAQRASREENDRTVFFPSLRQKNLDTIMSELDLLGYVVSKNDRGMQLRTITFDPTDYCEGKNTCSLPAQMTIPNIKSSTQNTFVTENIIKPYISMLQAKEEMNKQYNEMLAQVRSSIADIKDATEANLFVDYMKGNKFLGNIREIASMEFSARVKALGLKYNKETKEYEVA